MKPTELRIGNWVKIEIEPTEFLTDKISKEIQIVSESIKLCQILPENYNPIPLTEEWLKKFGFTIVRVPSAYRYDCNKWSESYLLRGAWNGKSWFALEILNNKTHKEIKYVHQLQNLYFALTEQELAATAKNYVA